MASAEAVELVAKEAARPPLARLGADPLTDFPDHDLATRALAGARTVIAVDTTLTDSVRKADVVLPATGYAETEGTTTNIEGRVSRLSPKVTPPGTARADWIIAAELAFRLGDDLRVESVADVFGELTTISAVHQGLTMDDVGVDGVVVPVPVVPAEPEPAVAPEEDTAEDADTASGDDTDTDTDTDDDTDTDEAGSVEPGYAGPDVGAGIDLRTTSYEIPQPDGYRLRLVTTRALYDLGTSTQTSPSLAKLPAGAVLRMHPHDFDRLGIEAGGMVAVSNTEGGRGSITVPVEASAGVPRGAASIAYAQPGGTTNLLIDADRPVTDVRVEVARA